MESDGYLQILPMTQLETDEKNSYEEKIGIHRDASQGGVQLVKSGREIATLAINITRRNEQIVLEGIKDDDVKQSLLVNQMKPSSRNNTSYSR